MVLIYLCLQPFSSSEYKIYLLIGVVLNIFSGLLMQFARGLGDMLAYSVSSFLTAASTVVLNVVFVAVLKLGAHGMFRNCLHHVTDKLVSITVIIVY